MSIVLKVIAVGLFVALGLSAQGQSKVDNEFRIKEKRYRDRIEDFYTRLNKFDRDNERRQNGEAAQRVERKRKIEEYEKKRLEFVLKRKNTQTPETQVWEKEKKNREVQYEMRRRDYVTRRNQLQKIMQGVDKLSEDEEYDLYFDEE